MASDRKPKRHTSYRWDASRLCDITARSIKDELLLLSSLFFSFQFRFVFVWSLRATLPSSLSLMATEISLLLVCSLYKRDHTRDTSSPRYLKALHIWMYRNRLFIIWLVIIRFGDAANIHCLYILYSPAIDPLYIEYYYKIAAVNILNVQFKKGLHHLSRE